MLLVALWYSCGRLALLGRLVLCWYQSDEAGRLGAGHELGERGEAGRVRVEVGTHRLLPPPAQARGVQRRLARSQQQLPERPAQDMSTT